MIFDMTIHGSIYKDLYIYISISNISMYIYTFVYVKFILINYIYIDNLYIMYSICCMFYDVFCIFIKLCVLHMP